MAQDLLTDAFVRLRHKLKTFSGRFSANPDGADDILQDCFVRLWRRQYPLHSEQEAEALLTRTVRNASLNERRRRRPVSLDTDPADESEDRQEREQVYEMMRQWVDRELTPVQKYILEEKEYAGRTLEDLARELGMESAAVRMQLSRARKKLRDKLSHA